MTRKERLKRKRRRRFFWRMRQALFGLACFMLVLAVANGLYNLIRFHGATEAEKQVLKHTRQYPDQLIDLMKENEETQEFVADYTKYKDKHFKIILSSDYKKGEIPYFLQWDKRWGYETYDGNYFAITGSAPTCLSMVSVGLSGDLNANPLAIGQYIEDNHYLTSDHKTDLTFMTEGAEYFDIAGKKLSADQTKMKQALESGKPLIAQVGSGDFTKEEHFIVIYDMDKQGNFLVYDPNSTSNSKKSWSFKTLQPQIKNVWCYTLL